MNDPQTGRFISLNRIPKCHSNEPYYCKDLCRKCYRKSAATRRRNGIYLREPKIRFAECHPDRKYVAKGLCAECSKAGAWKKRRAKENYMEDNLGRHLGIYNLTVEKYKEMLVQQDGKCAICLTDTPVGKNRTRFDVDHDHETNEVRGLLCLNCNRLLSAAKDNTEILWKAIKYLKG